MALTQALRWRRREPELRRQAFLEAWLARNRLRLGSDDDGNLLVIRQQDRAWVVGEALAVNEDLDAVGAAVAANTRAAQSHTPFGEELAEPVRDSGCGFGVENAIVEVRVQRRNARVDAKPDAPVCRRAVRLFSPLNAGIVDVDPDSRRHDHACAVDEDVEVGVDVMDESLPPFRP